MRVGILSDIHSNIEALEAVLEKAKDEGVERFVCLGDVVGYGADPNPCCDVLKDILDFCLLGNHDAAVIGAMEESYYYEEARQALRWTRNRLSPENLRWLYTLPYTYEEGDYGYFHAAPIQPSGFYYVIHSDDAAHHMRVFDKLPRYSFVGHSHLTRSFLLGKDKVKDITGKPTIPKPHERVIVTAGSVGQPRDRNPDACFVVLDTEPGTYRHVRAAYDAEVTANKIHSAGLSARFAQRLLEGA
jgi:diadenosine tetraphosphatase ApaH/serine/threonine PP2A family protein phosphatase